MFDTQQSHIYLDHHATTPVLPEVVEAMRPFWSDNFGNPSSAHSVGRKARQALEDARDRIALLLGAQPDEVIFTSGATEANNLAIFGLADDPPGHILASPIEHPCVMEPLKQLAARGFDVDWLPVLPNGSIAVNEISHRVRSNTRLITLMQANHETGVVQSVRDAAASVPGVPLHTDAAQAVGKLPMLSFQELGVASLSASGHKFGGPKGIGVLLVRRGQRLSPQLVGGHQQNGKRPGTEPVALAIGFATALELVTRRKTDALGHVGRIHMEMIRRLREGASPVVLNSASSGSPYVLNISFPGCRADLLLMKLDLMGVACSTGSACSSGSLLPSPVLRAMGLSDELLESAMRFSFSSHLSLAQIELASDRIIKAVNELRTANSTDLL